MIENERVAQLAEVKLFSDSSSDLSDAIYEENDIGIVPFYVTFDKVTYYKERIDITVKEFFKRLKSEKSFPKTSLPTVHDYVEAFRPSLEKGVDVVCLCITAKFSGSYQSAVGAVEELKPEFPDRVIRVIDSWQASCGQGVSLMQMIGMKKAGYDANAIADKMEEIKSTARVILTVDSLEYLQKGGRIGKVSALAGTLLQIKPLIVQRDGELNPDGKVRGRQKALDKVIEMTDEYVGSKRDDYDYLLLNADCYDEAVPVEQKMIAKGYKFIAPIQDLGITIGSHTGPTLIGVSICKKFNA
jgi:DegV family protein with EDD domain